MIIYAKFSNANENVTVDIYNQEDVLVVDSAATTHTVEGLYKYDFIAADAAKSYYCVFTNMDSGTKAISSIESLDEFRNSSADIHTALDSYTNKELYKADVSSLSADVNVVEVAGVAVTGVDDFKADTVNVDLSETNGKLDSILQDTADMQSRVIEIEERTAEVLTEVGTLGNYTTLHADLDAYANKDAWKGTTVTDTTAILGAIDGLNDVSAVEVRAAFNVEDFKSKNTENEIHTYLDSYLNKDNWKADVSMTQTVLDAVNGLNDLSLAEVEGSTVLAKATMLSAVASDVTSLINDGYVVDLDPVLTVLAGMNDVSAADVRAAFDENEFKDKNTELEIHAWLDSYGNKDDWKADVPEVDLGPILSAIGALNDLSLIDIEGSTVLAKKAMLDAIATNVAEIPTEWVSLTPVLSAISGLNDVTVAEVRAAFNEADFKDKNTETEIHNWLDSYDGKEDWGGTLTTTTKTELTTEIWDKVV